MTEMHVVIQYDPSFLEAVGDTITHTMSRDVEEDLERFKRLAEGHDPEKAGGGSGPHLGEHGSQGTQAVYSKDKEA